MATTSIGLSDNTKKGLADIGNKDDSYNDIVEFLINFFIETKSRGDGLGTRGSIPSS